MEKMSVGFSCVTGVSPVNWEMCLTLKIECAFRLLRCLSSMIDDGGTAEEDDDVCCCLRELAMVSATALKAWGKSKHHSSWGFGLHTHNVQRPTIDSCVSCNITVFSQGK